MGYRIFLIFFFIVLLPICESKNPEHSGNFYNLFFIVVLPICESKNPEHSGNFYNLFFIVVLVISESKNPERYNLAGGMNIRLRFIFLSSSKRFICVSEFKNPVISANKKTSFITALPCY